ncbi:MAG: sulfite exporter TauE/SafE family protein [Planctomycetes bacterium]|nr:sulfite exporter TauE/SafE family protein [Planctomycetota bacterium]
MLFESFVFGAANSVHCACMCGPLALAFDTSAMGAISYHIGRTISYGALGVGLGALGAAFGSDQLGAPGAWVSFVLAAGLVLLALVGERGALRLPGLGRLAQRALGRARRLPAHARAGALGLATPLLPCGLLWSACAGATVAGSGLAGGGVMVGFALGSLPLLLLAQTQVARLLQRFGPRTLSWVQRAAMLGAAAVLAWRGVMAVQGSSCCD